MKLVEIAAQLGVPDGTVRRWKSTGAWGSERSDKGERSGKKASVRKTPPPEVVSVMKNPDLTDSQRLFCLYYSRSFNATRSYQKAYGCSYAVANAEGPALLVKPSVREEITRLKQMRYGKALLEPEDLFQKYMDIAFADLTDYVSFGQEEQPVMAMYGPGFFTGRLIQRFGAVRMAAAGLLITAASVAVGLSGLGVYHYWLSLILLGIGWNFGFTGASAKIIDFHRPEEKTQVQSLNDFLVFGVMIVGSFSSGVLLNAFGWNAVLWGSLVPVAVALLTLLLRPLSPPRA